MADQASRRTGRTGTRAKAAHTPRPGHTPSPTASPQANAAGDFSVYFLDMGLEKYGDCMILIMGDKTVMIDGGHPQDFKPNRWPDHPSIPEQLETIFGHGPPFSISLLVVTHAHSDHIGCLPTLISQGTIDPEFALVCDPDLGWGKFGGTDAEADAVSDQAARMAAAIREESRVDVADTAALRDFIQDAANLETNYRQMLSQLGKKAARFGNEADTGKVRAIIDAMSDTGMQILGPTDDQLQKCAQQIAQLSRETRRGSDIFIGDHPDAATDDVELYKVLALARADSADAAPAGSSGPCINDQSIVLTFDYRGKKLFFSGDMQLSQPQFNGVNQDMSELRDEIAKDAPYSLVKFPHHGSFNGINPDIFQSFESKFFGLCAGKGDPDHPSTDALGILNSHSDITWARTDKNGLVAFHSTDNAWKVEVSSGSLNDGSPNSKLSKAGKDEIAPSQKAQVVTTSTADDNDVVQITARVPRRATRLTVTVDLQPSEVAAPIPFLEGRQ